MFDNDYETDVNDEVEEEVEAIEEDDDEIDFSKLFNLSDDDEPEDEENLEEDTGEDTTGQQENLPRYNEETGDWEDPSTGEKLLSQSRVNELLGSSRIKGREYEDNVKYLEHMTGMPFGDVVKQVRESQINKAVEEYNMPPEEAQRYVDAIPTNRLMQEQMLQIKSQQEMHQAMLQRESEKREHLNNPLALKFEKEVDKIVDGVAQQGGYISWGIALNQVLGEKAYKGELKDVFDKTAQRRAAKARHPKVAPEFGGGAPATESVPKELAFFAKALGEDPKEVFKEHKRIQKER